METKHSAVCDVMSRDRFLKLLTLIHFQDNLDVSDDAKKDKLWKLKPWLKKLRKQFLSIPPEECHAVDEIIVPFKGKSHLRVGVQDVGTCRAEWFSLWLRHLPTGRKSRPKAIWCWCYRRRCPENDLNPSSRKKSQGLCRQLFYISPIGGALEKRGTHRHT